MYMRNIADIIPKWTDIHIADILELSEMPKPAKAEFRIKWRRENGS